MAKSEKVEMIKLNLTIEQAFYLRVLLLNVGGSPEGPRGMLDEIYTELGKYSGDFEDLQERSLDVEGSVYISYSE